ncbi:hypothetical protein RDT67_06805 [Serratia fonticola]|uniref:Uncharacterized protein n=1 Tax=Serratia fonticola TaxID=47917 RepID=A0AAJ1YCU7_SERFO|nr:hypothetical protein [Serratia fonticola]MDQ9126140.1 hypothetical protein [Serratia fonticola]
MTVKNGRHDREQQELHDNDLNPLVEAVKSDDSVGIVSMEK